MSKIIMECINNYSTFILKIYFNEIEINEILNFM